MIEPKHRKTVEHYDDPGQAHELTFSCVGRRPLLVTDAVRGMLSQSIGHAMSRHGFDLNAFVIMPEHVHLVVSPTTPESKISNLLYAIKRPFSYRIRQRLEATDARVLQRLTIQERPGKMTFRF